MRELGVLVSTDGPDHNVLKVKPPLVWLRMNSLLPAPFEFLIMLANVGIHVDFFIATLERVLREDACKLASHSS